jgi:hypothetical protein
MTHSTDPARSPRPARIRGAALTLAFAANLCAQGSELTAPAGGSASGSIWRAGPNRVQCLYDTSLFTGQGVTRAMQIDRLQWRSANGVPGAAVAYPSVDVYLGESATDVLAPSNTFAANRTGGHTLVYSGPVTVVPAAGTTPNSFTIDLPLAVPYRYDPTGTADLLLEIVIHAAPSPATGTTVDTSSSAAAHGANTVRSVGSVSATTGTLSGFCPVVKFGYTTAASGPVVVNEFVYDDTGTDNREFVELFNRSGQPVDLSGWQLTSADAQGPNPAYTIPAGVVLAPGAFYVLGSPQVPGAHQVVGTSNLWENDTESLTLRDAQGRIVDTLVYEAAGGVFDPNLAEREGLWGETISTDGVASAWGRCPDGYDTDNNGLDFWVLPVTPGASNSMYVSLPYTRDFDAQLPGSAISGWGSGSAAPHVVDPTQPGPYNPVAIPPSPQGGLAAAFGNPATGNNSNTLTAAVNPGRVFDAYVWFDASPAAPGQPRSWTLGFGNPSGTYRHPDPSGTLGVVDNGSTGLGWTYQVIGSTATLYLIDHNDGGWGPGARTRPVVGATIPIQPGVNDGWQRLRLHILGRTAVGSFGEGTSLADAVVVEPWETPEYLCCQISWHPCCAGQDACVIDENGDCQTYVPPPVVTRGHFFYAAVEGTQVILDQVHVAGSTAFVTTAGSGSANSQGTTPILVEGSPPVAGNTEFQVAAARLLPNNVSFLLLGLSNQTVPIPGAPGAASVLMPDAVLAMVSNGRGRVVHALPLPGDPAFVGLPVSWQSVDIDMALPFAIPIATSPVLTTTIGSF